MQFLSQIPQKVVLQNLPQKMMFLKIQFHLMTYFLKENPKKLYSLKLFASAFWLQEKSKQSEMTVSGLKMSIDFNFLNNSLLTWTKPKNIAQGFKALSINSQSIFKIIRRRDSQFNDICGAVSSFIYHCFLLLNYFIFSAAIFFD